jgi:hypothetical protein
MLLRKALLRLRDDELRHKLLISRLVRYHWDNAHMAIVKEVYHKHYNEDLQEAVGDATSGDLSDFCVALCITNMPDHVGRIEEHTRRAQRAIAILDELREERG